METIALLGKVAIPVGGVVLSAVIGGRLFWVLVKHFIVKYFENLEKKISASFVRTDEMRDMFKEFKNLDYRDYKRDTALEIQSHKDSLKELYDRTDNHEAVKQCVEYCDRKNKQGAKQ